MCFLTLELSPTKKNPVGLYSISAEFGKKSRTFKSWNPYIFPIYEEIIHKKTNNATGSLLFSKKMLLISGMREIPAKFAVLSRLRFLLFIHCKGPRKILFIYMQYFVARNPL
jgi:hypothetical protein